MKILTFSSIKYDECLSSWISRNSSNFDPNNLIAFFESSIDIDFDFSSTSSLQLLNRAKLDTKRLEAIFRAHTNWTLSQDSRLAYCSECLKEDVASGGPPYWRKSWCYLHCPICIRHKSMLSLGEPFDFALDKTWGIFLGDCRAEWGREVKNIVPWRQSNAAKRAILLALRVQRLLISAHRKRMIVLPGWSQPVNSNDFLCFSKFLFEEFLLPRGRGPHSDGIARLTQCGMPRLSSELTLQELINAGCSDCNAFCRITALVLIGCVFGLFPQERFVAARKSLELSAGVNCGSAFSIARHGIATPKAHAIDVVELLLESSSWEFKNRLSDFVAGLC